LHSDLFIFLLLLFIVWHLLFFHRSYGEPARTEVRILRVHVTRIEAQATAGRGRSPGRPEVASPADEHNSTGSAVVSISVSQSIKEDCIACFPAISIEVPTFREVTTHIVLTTITCILSCRSESCKCSSFWLNIPRWGRGVDCFCCCCICYAWITCEILVPELEAMAAAPVIITYIIEREWVLNSSGCSLITTNSQPLTLVIIIGLKFLRL